MSTRFSTPFRLQMTYSTVALALRNSGRLVELTSVFGRAGKDYFRADGSYLTEDWANTELYNQVGEHIGGHNLFINDYEYGERISIEDFGLTRADQTQSQVDPAGYTDIIITVNGTEYTPVTVKGNHEYGVVYSRGDEHSDQGIDYGITFYDPNKVIGGTTTAFKGDDNLSLFGDVWKPELDIKFLVPNKTLIYKGGDGQDDFSGGPSSDHFEGGLGDDRVLYLDLRGIRIAEEFNAENDLETRIFDGMGKGGVDTVDSIRDIYASTGDDYIELLQPRPNRKSYSLGW